MLITNNGYIRNEEIWVMTIKAIHCPLKIYKKIKE